MKRKKVIIILISIALLIVIISLVAIVLFNKKEDNLKTNNIKKEIISEEKIDKEKKEEIKKEEKDEDKEKEELKEETSIEETKPSNNNQNNNPITNSNNVETVVVPPQVPKKPVYSCPGGYVLNGTQCISTVDASFGCSDGLVEFSDGNVSGCVNLNDAYVVSEESSCKPGEGTLLMITIGGPDTYKCIPIRAQKSYSCPGGYSLQGTTCTSVIGATVS